MPDQGRLVLVASDRGPPCALDGPPSALGPFHAHAGIEGLDGALPSLTVPAGAALVIAAGGTLAWRVGCIARLRQQAPGCALLASADHDDEVDALLNAGAHEVVEATLRSRRLAVAATQRALQKAALAAPDPPEVVHLRQTEIALVESRERLQAALDGSGAGTFRWDIRTNALDWDENLDRLFGLEPGSTVRSLDRFIERVHEDERQGVIDRCNHCATEGAGFDMEFRVVWPDGSVHWLDDKGKTFLVDGKPAYMTGMCIDITARKQVLQALRDSEAFFRQTLESVPGMSFTNLPDGTCVYLSEQWSAFTGREVAGLLGDGWLQVLHPDDRQSTSAAWYGAVAGLGPYDVEYRIRRRDGVYEWFKVRGIPLRDSQGDVVRWFGMAVNVNDLKLAEAGIRESEERFRTMADHISQLAWMTDREGNITWYNRRWFEYTGTTLEQVRGWGWRIVHHPDHLQRVVDKISRCFATGEPWEDTFPLRGRDGAYRWFLSRAVPIVDERGTIVRWFGTNTDVTDQRRVEEALRRREHELRTLTDSSPDVLTRFDRQFRHVFVSGAIERATGRHPAELVGRSNRELGMPPDLCDLWEGALQDTFTSGQRRSLEFRFPSPDGYKYFSAELVPEFGADDTVEYVIGVTHDRTAERVAALALEEASRRKDEFLATLAHELRNPLAPIRNGLLALQRTRDPERVERLLAMMDRQLEHMVRLIDDLLDVSRISSGKVVLRVERMAVRTLMEMALEATRPTIDAGRHRVLLHLPEADLTVNADATRMSQVFSNLLTNAAKYTTEGGLIEMGAAVRAGTVEVTVRDNGAGIPPDMLEEVFALFAQVNRTLDRAQGGLGIGLALVRRLVELHGGSVFAHSAGLGCGSTFTVTLPLAQPEPHASPAPACTERQNPPTGQTILVVDDNGDAADSLALLLELGGHRVTVARDGHAALRAMSGPPPDAAFVDIGMPGVSGHEVARRWREQAGWHDTMLVALTGWGTEEDKRKSAAAGFDHHLTKPVELTVVEELLRRNGDRATAAPRRR